MNGQPAGSSVRLIPQRLTPDGWHIDTIHYSLVPDYDYDQACEGLTDEGIRRELEIDWSASEGKRVYPQFGRKTHVAVEPLKLDPNREVYCGWDFGGTPAFVVTQINVFGQWLIFPSVSPPEEMTVGIYEFGQHVADYLYRTYCQKRGLKLTDLKLVHFGDPNGAARPPRTGDGPRETQSCFDILNRGLQVHAGTDDDGKPVVHKRAGLGWRIQPGAVNITDRLEAVRSRLTLNLHQGNPALVCDPDAEAVITGFLGGYHYPQRADGSYAYDPKKDFYSHTMDALGYIATRLFVRVESGDDDEDEDSMFRRTVFRSGAASRYGY